MNDSPDHQNGSDLARSDHSNNTPPNPVPGDNPNTANVDPVLQQTHPNETLIEPKKKKGFCSYVMMGCVSVIAVIFLILFILLMIVLFQYRSYSNSITNEGDPTHLVSTTNLTEEERTELQDRLASFQEQQSETTFVQFTPRELGVLIFTIVEDQSTQPISLEAVHVRPSEGQWDLSFKLAWEGRSLPWATIEVFKEDQESAELYFPTIKFAGIDIEDIGLGFIVDRVNEGYREALLITDEGSVTSRFYENIELTEDLVIIKTRAVEEETPE